MSVKWSPPPPTGNGTAGLRRPPLPSQRDAVRLSLLRLPAHRARKGHDNRTDDRTPLEVSR